MRFCTKHHAQLTDALGARSLGHMIAKSPEESVERLANPTKDNFDPFVAAHNLLMRAATKAGGLEMAMDPNACPMCVADDTSEGLATVWIEGASDDVKAYAVENGLLKIVQAA